jgi:7,8-dihydropterin-6-yl-methyl-4-(beta-D-ribofuranosyl)aminobenzene 5'-phosphate synthase
LNAEKPIIVFVVFLSMLLFGVPACHADMRGKAMNGPIITVVFDNNPYKEGLTSGWGFSCLVEGMGKTVLFDTGADGEVLLANMAKLGIDPEAIETVVISHEHGDHMGGLARFLRRNPDVDVYLPASVPGYVKEGIKSHGANVVDVGRSVEISKEIFSSGEMNTGLKEQSLILRTPEGMVIITGCAHPGIVNIVKTAKELFGDDVLLVTGGFHLAGTSDSAIETIISEMKTHGVRYVAPCHCTGKRAQELFKKAFGPYYIETGVGRTIDVKAL